MAFGLGQLLDEVIFRLQQKKHLGPVTSGWERRVGIITEDTKCRWQLMFTREGTLHQEWKDEDQADLVLQGKERSIQMLFAGDEMIYTMAKQQVKMVGTCRDQLKLDAILRLTCK